MADSNAVESHAGTSSEGLRKRPTSVSGSTATGRAQNNEQREMDDTDIPKEAPLGKTPDGKSEYSMVCVRTCHFRKGTGSVLRLVDFASPLSAVFAIPQTHNMLSSLFDPRLPKSVSAVYCVIAPAPTVTNSSLL